MKFIRLDLLTLLISLFILNGCKNQDTIGLGVVNSNQISGNLVDTSTIVINTIADDTVITNGLATTPLSFLKDPVFGTTEANMVMDINLPNSTAYTLPTGTITVDSALLVLKYARGNFYGDSLSSRYKANVYQLKERVFQGTPYYNNKIWDVNRTVLLGTKSFVSRTSDSVQVLTPIASKPDSLVKVAPQLRIPINPSFINDILYNAPAVQRGSNLVFKNNVKGFYITLDQAQSGPGGTFMFNMGSEASVQIYYKNVNGTVIDTGVLVLPSTIAAAEIKHAHSPTINTEIANANTGGRKLVYLQGLGGLRSKISFPYLKKFAQTVGGNVIINRAELVVKPLPGSTIPFAPLPRLAMYRYDIAKQRIFIQDGTNTDPRSFGSNAPGGFFITQDQQYHFLITAYIQDLMSGAVPDYGSFIGPVLPTSTTSIFPSAQNDGRTVAVGFDKTSPYSIKLNIFYTKVAK
ncbi:MAG: DUF4270 family protein [Bacteroidota bacterium]